LRAATTKAATELSPLVYGELRKLAASRMARLRPGQTLQPTALVHEVYLELVGKKDPGWKGRGHFFGAAAHAMRELLVDAARRKSALKRGGDLARGKPEEAEGAAIEPALPVEELFDALFDRDPNEAARAIDEACAGDQALSAAVAGLLAHDRIAARELRPPSPAAVAQVIREARRGATTVPEGDDDGAAPTRDPSQLGRFFVLRRLGEGGMGVVYVGYDDLLDRRVALKLLRRGLAGRDALLRGAQALARLTHPNVVAVAEVGEHEGQVFLAMELAEGRSLRGWPEPRPPLLEVLGVFLQAGRGLAAAHDAGLVHRDFKPDNVLVGNDGRVRVVDFGIAAPVEPDVEAAPSVRRALGRSPRALERGLTQTGAFVGTPAYMAPERFRGERATAQSDQFGFCVVLYLAAYGAAPFPGSAIGERRGAHPAHPRAGNEDSFGRSDGERVGR
jgi:RNA polymerase sigma factor (TIGR02999 family)